MSPAVNCDSPTPATPLPFHVRRIQKTVEPLYNGKSGPVLGVFERSVYFTDRCELHPEDLIMLYTDGLYEVESPDGEFYSLKHLIQAVRRRVELPASQLFDELLAEIGVFANTTDLRDDMCLVGLEVKRTLVAAPERDLIDLAGPREC